MIGCAVALAAPVASHAAEIKVLTSRAMNHVPTDLGGTFERASGHKVTLVLAPPAEIQKRVENGESVDTDPAVGGASGIHFEKVLDRLGIAKEIKAKSIRNPQAATKPSAEFVARGEAELGIQLISEIVSVPGAELLGPFPGELQAMTDIFAGVLTTAPEPEAARALLKFLTSPAAAPAIKAAGMDPVGL